MRTRTNSGRGLAAVLALSLATVLVAADGEAGKKNKKKKNNKKATQASSESVAPTSTLSKPSAAVREAERHLLAYDTGAARGVIDGLDSGGDAWVATALGRALEQEKNYDAAVAELRRAADRDPANPAPVLFLGETYLHADQAGAASDAFAQTESRARALLSGNPNDAQALYYLGVAQQRQRRFDDAVATLEKARAAEPGNALTIYQLGATKAFQEKWQEAVDLLNEAIDQNSGIAYAYYYRGLAAGKLGRKDLLINDLDRFLAMAPEAPEAETARKILGAA